MLDEVEGRERGDGAGDRTQCRWLFCFGELLGLGAMNKRRGSPVIHEHKKAYEHGIMCFFAITYFAIMLGMVACFYGAHGELPACRRMCVGLSEIDSFIITIT